METKFNFKSQICTTREQSERLLALSLKKETADMYWTKPFNEWIAIVGDGNTDEDNIPAWSLHRLWELANIKHIILDSQDEIPQIYNCVIDHIESQIKEGILDKKYLED